MNFISSLKSLGPFCVRMEVIVGIIFSFSFNALAADSVPITILHTNDVHSHFRPDRGPLRLGGVARMKTAIDQVRSEVPQALLVDGGDWSEGSVYYYEGAGTEALRMLDQLGYDAAVIGNHDWLNGPDTLFDDI